MGKDFRDRLHAGALGRSHVRAVLAPSMSDDGLLCEVHPRIRPFVKGKQIARATVRVCKSAAKPVPVVPGTTIEDFFGTRVDAPDCDSITFTDGSVYCWEGGKERIKCSPGTTGTALSAAGLFRGFRDDENWWFVTPQWGGAAKTATPAGVRVGLWLYIVDRSQK